MRSSADKKVKSLVIKLIICILLAAFLVFMETSWGYKKIPFNRISINETKNDIKSKIQQVNKMNTELSEIGKKTPMLVKNADKIKNSVLTAKSSNKESLIDIPSMLVYLEQTGKNTGLVVKKIDIGGLSDIAKSRTANNKDIGKKLIITAVGSYKSFSDYIKEIQINTKERITIEGFKFLSSENSMSTCQIEIEISL